MESGRKKIWEKLITEGDALTLQKAIQIGQSYEYAQKQLTEMKSDSKVESIRAKTKTNWKPRPSSSAAAATMAVPTATRQRHQQMGGIRLGTRASLIDSPTESLRQGLAKTVQAYILRGSVRRIVDSVVCAEN